MLQLLNFHLHVVTLVQVTVLSRAVDPMHLIEKDQSHRAGPFGWTDQPVTPVSRGAGSMRAAAA